MTFYDLLPKADLGMLVDGLERGINGQTYMPESRITTLWCDPEEHWVLKCN
jgi:hypothetical protein